jgi:serine/threonine protein kinase
VTLAYEDERRSPGSAGGPEVGLRLALADGNASSAPAVVEDETSFRIGRYQIRGEIGRGAMGVVYEAHDPSLRRTIALKTFHLSFSVSPHQYKEFEEHFFTEARIAAGLSHPGIVAVHDVGCDPEIGTLYIALEYLKGRTLQQVIKDGVPLGWREALRITRSIAEALHYAHSQQVVHRDIKPANIMLLPSGDPKILDFGIAKMQTMRSNPTTAFQVVGTPLFMAPEQALGHQPDGRADLFSLGAIAYTLLTGRLAFGASSIPATVRRVVEDDPEPPSQIIPDLPPGIDAVIARLLAKSPDHRHSCGRALAQDIQALLDDSRTSHGSVAAGRAGDGPLANGSLDIEREHLDRTERVHRDLAAPPAVSVPGLLDVDAELAVLVSNPAACADSALARGARRVLRPLHLLLVCMLGVLSVGYVSPRGRSDATEGTARVERPATEVLSPARGEAEQSQVPSGRETPPPVREAERAVLRTAGKPTLSNRSPARLKIEFEHPLKRGTLRLWIDNEVVLLEELNSRDPTNLSGLRLPKGRIDREIAVKPGERSVLVQVRWDDNDRQQRLSGTFKPGVARELEINLGRLRKNLSAEWK